MVRDVLRSAAAIGALLCASGCAGARTNVVAPNAAYPISMSQGVRDADGRLVARDRLTKLASLESRATAWSMLYSYVPLTPETDISDVVNAQVKAAGGDAVLNLRVMAGNCATQWFFGLNVLPFWPGCLNVRVEGDIVKVTRPARSRTAARGASVSQRLSASMEAVP
ncbi:MAG: hypothetical protein KC657_31545 [Myxococcales bacterium]|nr:hypothetical protein [Myxococcales bacterium]